MIPRLATKYMTQIKNDYHMLRFCTATFSSRNKACQKGPWAASWSRARFRRGYFQEFR